MEFLPLIAIALLFWLLIIRPASKRQKDVAKLQAGLGSGDRVLLSSGLFGTVRETQEDRIRVEIAPGVVVDVARGAVAAVDPAAAKAEGDDGRGIGGEGAGPHSTDGDDTPGTTGA